MPQWAGAERPNGALYNTTLWRKLRREVLREIGQCVICGATDRLHVHHITPPKGDEALFYDRNNLTVLCESCHARMTSAEAREVKGAKR
jgi:5-methylcytosine-specific restriction endonuclease McrA